jgi:aminoglycoside phosphotransferase (APT) family kinase protein
VSGVGPRSIDAEHLGAICARHLGEPMTIEGLRRLSGGASRESWSFDAVMDGDRRRGLVLRRDPGSTNVGQADRSTEYRLLHAASSAGVPVPTVQFLLEDVDDIGDGFVMDRVEGETIPRRILRDDEYADARPRLAAQCGVIAAEIHAVELSGLPKLAMQGPREQIEQYRGILDALGEPHPAFELGLRWLEDHISVTGPDASPRLVHGDFRNGNFIVGPEGIRSVLDWELAHLGDPVEDLGWLCVKSWRFGNLDQPVGGFGSTEALLAAYAQAGGSTVDAEHLHYWETFGTLKWGVICEMQCFSHLHGLVRSVELAALGRRIAETEWDLLELIA